MTAVLALALGIGANAAIFSVVNAVILKPVPYEDPDTLVQFTYMGNGVRDGTSTSRTLYMHLRALTDVIEDVAAYSPVALNYGEGDSLERVSASRVTEPYFRAFRAPIAQGRTLTSEESLPDGPRTAVVSHSFWTQRLGGDADVIGRTLSFGGTAYTVVGVVAPDFDTREFGGIDVWLPLEVDPNTTDHSTGLQVVARLKPGVTLEQAQARVEASITPFYERYGQVLNPGVGISVAPIQVAIVRQDARRMLWTLLGAVGLVLLIACTNVANLLLARASGRGQDFAVRTALGAGRWRIARQLLTESALLSAAGGALGLVLGFVGMRALLAVSTAGLPRLGETGALMGMDWRVVGFTVGVSALTAFVFGLLPAISLWRTNLNDVIKLSSNRSAGSYRQHRMRSLLVVAQIGLAIVLLIGAALLIRTSMALGNVDPGVTIDNIIVMRTPLSGPGLRTTAGVMEVVTNTLDTLRSIPNVEAATASNSVPLQPTLAFIFNIMGRVQDRPFTGAGVVEISTGGYFETFEIPLLRGRVFNERDDAGATPVVVINRALAERWWPDGQDPLGERMVIGGGSAVSPTLADEPVREIIGVVGDVRTDRLTDPPRAGMYLPQAQITDLFRSYNAETNLAWIVRTRVDPLRLAPVIRETIRQTTGGPVIDIETMEQILSSSTSRQQANMFLMTVFGGVALLLAAIGIYGLVALSVQLRTHEIGVRMALGAQRDRIARMVVRQGIGLVAMGTAIGLAAAFFLADVLASVLFGVEARDPTVFVGVPFVLVLISIAAVSIPALRASRVDPLSALRYE
jgi:predicted permease